MYYVCVFVYVYTHTHTYTHARTHAHTHTHTMFTTQLAQVATAHARTPDHAPNAWDRVLDARPASSPPRALGAAGAGWSMVSAR
jgi:hypothetical protein